MGTNKYSSCNTYKTVATTLLDASDKNKSIKVSSYLQRVTCKFATGDHNVKFVYICLIKSGMCREGEAGSGSHKRKDR